MVNEERLGYMIKMSKFDTHEDKKCKAMMQYARKDYISMELLKSFVTGTIAYALIAVLVGLDEMDAVLSAMNAFDYQGFFFQIVITYLIFMAVYMFVTYLVYNMKYTAGRRKVKKYYANLKRVNEMYDRDDKLKKDIQ